jgi:hypothetical protein
MDLSRESIHEMNDNRRAAGCQQVSDDNVCGWFYESRADNGGCRTTSPMRKSRAYRAPENVGAGLKPAPTES